ncbi:MAG TPA: hypothetical protein PLW50_09810 [Smithellaceae bacterium]|nr:hypothetical protein [Smithellaceae bacterium]
MRLIFSRKGLDSQYGGVPSPIFPNGTMLSLPIPSAKDVQCLKGLRHDGVDVGALAADLTGNRINRETHVHFDPDLRQEMMERSPGWMPAFGQIAAAQSHLAKQGVGKGDIFLFFGWFRHVEQFGSRWRYVPGSPDFHAIFGWLQVDEVLSIGGNAETIAKTYPWLRSHPHVAGADRFESPNNTIYVGTKELMLAGKKIGLAGGGSFAKYFQALRLTAEGRTRSIWHLPAWFSPIGRKSCLTYHGNPLRWIDAGESVLLQTVAKGQEFILDCAHYPESVEWIKGVFAQDFRENSWNKP